MQLKKVNNKLQNTPLYHNHIKLGAKIVDFGGWNMPLYYKEGIIAEHLSTRKSAGLFDISHMGRFTISGKNSMIFLQHVLTNNVAALDVGESQYTIISDENGIAIDDAYLYRYYKDEYILVLNASNTKKDLKYLQNIGKNFINVNINNATDEISMLSLQGPKSEKLLFKIIPSGNFPKTLKNKLDIIYIDNIKVLIARTGYTGEPCGFELFVESKSVLKLWTLLLSKGSSPVGLGARDTLRLEAGLPLYGHELGVDSNSNKIPIFSIPQSPLAVSFSSIKKDFVGRTALKIKSEARKRILKKDFSQIKSLPKIIMKLELLKKAIARPGEKIYFDNNQIGYVTSGTIAPYWIFRNINNKRKITNEYSTRSIALAMIDSRRCAQDIVDIETRAQKTKAIIMPYFLKVEAPPYAYPVTAEDILNKDCKKI